MIIVKRLDLRIKFNDFLFGISCASKYLLFLFISYTKIFCLIGKLKEETVIFSLIALVTLHYTEMFTSVEYNFLYWDKNSNEEFLSRNVWSEMTSSVHVLLNSYSTVAHNASRPNIHMLTLVPILNCLLFYSSPHPPIYPRASTHPFAFSFHRDTFSFQMCKGHHFEWSCCWQYYPLCRTFAHQPDLHLFGVDGLLYHSSL